MRVAIYGAGQAGTAVAALLTLLQAKINTEDGATTVLSHFAGEPDAQRFLARAILRRTVDLRLAAAVSRVLFGTRIDWTSSWTRPQLARSTLKRSPVRT